MWYNDLRKKLEMINKKLYFIGERRIQQLSFSVMNAPCFKDTGSNNPEKVS